MRARFSVSGAFRGQGLVEYMILLALTAVVILVALPALNDVIKQSFSNVVDGITEAPRWEPIAWDYSGSGSIPSGGGGGGGSTPSDSDNDGVPDTSDNCVSVSNPAAVVSGFHPASESVGSSEVLDFTRVVTSGTVAVRVRRELTPIATLNGNRR